MTDDEGNPGGPVTARAGEIEIRPVAERSAARRISRRRGLIFVAVPVALIIPVALAVTQFVGVDSDERVDTKRPTAGDGPLQFVLDDEYEVGEVVAVRLRNRGNTSFVYNTEYAACDLEYLDDTGRKFLIPPGTHCDIIMHAAVDPGQTVTLFLWDLSECTHDRWGCVKSRPLEPGRYTIRGSFRENKASGRGHPEEDRLRSTVVETTFRIVDRKAASTTQPQDADDGPAPDVSVRILAPESRPEIEPPAPVDQRSGWFTRAPAMLKRRALPANGARGQPPPDRNAMGRSGDHVVPSLLALLRAMPGLSHRVLLMTFWRRLHLDDSQRSGASRRDIGQYRLMLCPTCGGEMADGWVAMWNPIPGQKVRWQPTKPRYGRLRVPQGAVILLKARVGGRDARLASRCSSCATVVLPPDSFYDRA